MASTKYLLPCECGEMIPVEPPQAGETVVCRCGKTLQVPGMLEMTKLVAVVAADSKRPASSAWGVRHGLVLAGIGLTGAAVTMLTVLLFRMPDAPEPPATPEEIRAEVEGLPPLMAWHEFHRLKAAGLDPAPHTETREYTEKMTRHSMWLAAAGIGILAGIALIVIPLAVPRRKGPSAA